MMNKEKFIRIVNLINNAENWTYDLDDHLGVDLSDTPLYEAYGVLVDQVMSDTFDLEACDLVSSFIFEGDKTPYYDEHQDKYIDISTPENLWDNYLIHHLNHLI